MVDGKKNRWGKEVKKEKRYVIQFAEKLRIIRFLLQEAAMLRGGDYIKNNNITMQ